MLEWANGETNVTGCNGRTQVVEHRVTSLVFRVHCVVDQLADADNR